MDEQVRVKLGSLQLQDVINERIKKLIKEETPVIVGNAILENLGYEFVIKDGGLSIYKKMTKEFIIIITCVLGSKCIDWSITLPDGRISSENNVKELIKCIEMAENDLREFKIEYGKNI